MFWLSGECFCLDVFVGRGFEWTCWRWQPGKFWGDLGDWSISKLKQHLAPFFQTRPPFREGSDFCIFLIVTFLWCKEVYNDLRVGNHLRSEVNVLFIQEKVSRHPLDLLDLELPDCWRMLVTGHLRGCLKIVVKRPYTNSLRGSYSTKPKCFQIELILSPKNWRTALGWLVPVFHILWLNHQLETHGFWSQFSGDSPEENAAFWGGHQRKSHSPHSTRIIFCSANGRSVARWMVPW